MGGPDVSDDNSKQTTNERLDQLAGGPLSDDFSRRIADWIATAKHACRGDDGALCHWPNCASACQGGDATAAIFDIDCMSVGGWLPETEWSDQVVPWLLRETTPCASGGWHITHAVEVETRNAAAARPSGNRRWT